MSKKLFKVIFIDEDKKIQTIHSSKLNPSSFLGLVEISDIVFLDQSELIIAPDDGNLKSKFKNVERSYIPLNSIIRIDEVAIEKETPVIRLYSDDIDETSS
ncbi:conserved hypothetical protein [Denitrovibrio acetiphilus DSM 12809]|uniref:DUF1820 family protein n=1 Tax=Denitrovibrio acetiphilus (strain DSM 12809 / NBRC 114555 / N2460) TaxID=522772 RepID=D4H8C3_DENA2|nr:DUF1820 family protein [Denitrovibrio acetiphilus]ADD68272.1 conserved hypothetical protein [Denitrovibrio acetiphilus DSM 12809]